jgi:hypothetical protein
LENSKYFSGICTLECPLTVSVFAKVAIFNTNVDAENQTLINHQPRLICGALNRHFCQLKISEAKPVLSGRAIILSSNFLIQFNQQCQLP